MKLHKPGMRNIKTGIGVMICVLVGYLHIIDNTLFAAVACIVCMQTTVKGSLTVGLNRLKGTFIGGINRLYLCNYILFKSNIIMLRYNYNYIYL